MEWRWDSIVNVLKVRMEKINLIGWNLIDMRSFLFRFEKINNCLRFGWGEMV